jgi:predicted permease
LSALFRRRENVQRVDEELEFHLQMQVEENIRRGLDPRGARRKLGNMTQVSEEVYHMNTIAFLDEAVQNVRFSLRTMRRNPGFALTAVLVLALGLGASTAMFSALDRILFRPLPYGDADRLVHLGWTLSAALIGPGQSQTILASRGYRERWKPVPEPFTAVTTVTNALGAASTCDVTEQPAERLICPLVESNFLATLGVRPFLGRDFTPEDDTRGTPTVAIISHDVWTRRFGRDPGAIGRTIEVNGSPIPVIGVLPAGFAMPAGEGDLLRPQQIYPIDPASPGASMFTVFGRLKPGVTPEQAQAAVGPVIMDNAKGWPGFNNGAQPRVVALRDHLVGDSARVAWLLLGAVALLLLIACVNVANLILARLAARNREFTVRAALGAGQARLARLALTESLLLAVAGGGLGLLLAAAMLRVFVQLAPSSIPEIDQASLDLRVFAVAAVLALAAGAAVGIWPALSVLRSRALHYGQRATSGGSSVARPRMRFTLVTVQIALTVAMLAGSALMLRTLWNLVSVPLGYQSERVVTMTVALNNLLYPNGTRDPFFERLLERVKNIPGTTAVVMTNGAPPAGAASKLTGMTLDGRPPDRQNYLPVIRARAVTPGYFQMFGIPIVRGRDFVETDRGALPVVILSEAAAQILFPGQDPLGHTVQLLPSVYANEWTKTAEVVGVARGIRNTGPTLEPEPEMYASAWFTNSITAYFAIRTQASTAAAAAFLKQAVADLDPVLPVTIEPADDQVSRLTERPRFIAWLLSAFAGFALLLAAAGLYGVASYLVTQRTRDIGVRIALGASPADISRQVVAEAGRWIVAGTLLGCALAWAGTRALEAQLYEVSSRDPLSWIAALGVLAVALLLAVLRPAARAARVDPMEALRAE